MASLRWRRPSRPGHVLPFINVPPDQTVIVCAAPDQYEYCILHCYDRGSIPCVGPDVCARCQEGDIPRAVGYAPALYLPNGEGSYVRGILCVGTSYGELAEQDCRSLRLRLTRLNRKDGSISKIKVKERTAIAAEVLRSLKAEWFDVKPRLEFRYGVETVPSSAKVEESAPIAAADDRQEHEGHILRFPGPRVA